MVLLTIFLTAFGPAASTRYEIPRLYSVQHVPSHRRELQTTVSNSASLTSALANTALSRIVLAPGTYPLSAQLSITRSVVLEAAVAGSVVLNAQANSSSPRRVLYINPGSLGIVQLNGLNITGGHTTGGAQGGAGVFVSSGTVTLTFSSIYGNTETIGFGGGVLVDYGGTVIFSSSTINGNTGGFGGGGVAVTGGTVSIINSQIYQNSAGRYGFGGGVCVYSETGTVAISNSQIYQNSVNPDGYGGGVCVLSGTVAISSSTISGNTAGRGGGVGVDRGTVTITTSTITGTTQLLMDLGPMSMLAAAARSAPGQRPSPALMAQSQLHARRRRRHTLHCRPRLHHCRPGEHHGRPRRHQTR